LEGFLLIDKPAGKTSAQCLGRIKFLIQQKGVRVGYAGTLDQFATGLLLVGIGRPATKLLSLILQLPKTYIGTGRLGILTDTYDSSGAVICKSDRLVSRLELERAMLEFGTGYLQNPPIYSALKHHGQRLSDLARYHVLSAAELEQISCAKARFVQLYALELCEFNFPEFTIQVRVSAGTYIRALINDVAVRVGSFATTIELARTSIGPFSIAEACALDTLNLGLIHERLISLNTMKKQLSLE